jgi:hypothetical protein
MYIHPFEMPRHLRRAFEDTSSAYSYGLGYQRARYNIGQDAECGWQLFAMSIRPETRHRPVQSLFSLPPL